MTRSSTKRPALLLLIVALLPALGLTTPVPEDPYDWLGRSVLEALRMRSYSRLQALTPPTPSIWRQLAPDEVGRLSDREISRKLRKSYYPKLRRDFNGIMQSARSRKIDLSKLEFLEVVVDTAAAKGSPVGIEIRYAYQGQTGTIAASAGALNGKYYLYEILLSYDVFARLFEK